MQPNAPTNAKQKQILTAIAVLVVVVVIVLGVKAFSASNKKETDSTVGVSQSTAATKETTANNTSTDTPATRASGYKNGTYNATGTYDSPGGTQSVKVTVTLQEGKVTTSTVVGQPNDAEAEEYQQSFIENFKSLVIGKSIDEIKLSRVSGSSLTSNGFNSAIQTIKNQAKA